MKKTMIVTLLIFSASTVFSQEGTEKELIKLSNDWMNAMMKKDEKTLNKIVAPEFKLRGAKVDDDNTVTREVWMKNTLENLKVDSFQYTKIKVIDLGNIAIVQSRFYWSVTFKDSPTMKDTADLIDTWVKKEGGWVVVNRILVE